MKRKILIPVSLAVAIALLFVLQGSFRYAMSYDGSAPAGYCGDPAGGNKNCTQCHGGTLNTVTGWITSDIPVTGYVPNTTYQITATATGTSGNKGFEISPQSSTGTFLGTLVAGTGTSLTGSSHYIRSSGSNITTNPKTWTFNWTAPATGLGPVTFYGAFVLGYGVLCNLCQYTVSESSTGITEIADDATFEVYPNPLSDYVNISYTLNSNSKVVINVYSIDGRKVACLLDSVQAEGSHSEKTSLKNLVSKGTYIIELKTNDVSAFRKIFVG